MPFILFGGVNLFNEGFAFCFLYQSYHVNTPSIHNDIFYFIDSVYHILVPHTT